MENISDHITYKEAIKSLTAKRLGIENTPNSDQLTNMKFWAINIFEPMRKALGNKPIGLASFFRNTLLNKQIGGAENSQHTKGEAADIDADIYNNGITNQQIFDYIKANCDFDQMIWEFGDKNEPDWVHASIKRTGTNRNQILVAYKDSNNKTKYKNYQA